MYDTNRTFGCWIIYWIQCSFTYKLLHNEIQKMEKIGC